MEVAIVSYNGSGTFNINSTGQPVVAGTVITASAFNALTTDLATGLTTAITKDGQTTTTARITFAQGISSTLTTDSTNTTSGSIITAGGVGIAKNLYVGVNANVAGAVTLQGTVGFGGVATFSAQPIFSSLTASSAVATDASKGLVSVTNTGTGNNVLATSPTITTATLASPNITTALTLTGSAGTSGQFLTSAGSGVAPTWSTPSSQLVLIGSATASNSANVSFTGLSLSAYSAILIVCNNLTVVTNAVILQCQMSSASSFATSGYAHVEFRMVTGGSASTGSTSDTQINICSSGDTINNSSTIGNSFTMTVYGPAQTTTYKQYTSQFSGFGSDYIGVTGQGAYKYATAIDGIKFFVSSGNMTTGNFFLYGIRNT